MGSESIEQTFMTTSEVKAAYRELCESAGSEYGDNPYSGTIATTAGVHLVDGVDPMTLDEAQKLAALRLDNLHKWGPCEAIPLVHETPAKYESTGERTVTVTVSGAVFSEHKKFQAAIAKELGIRTDQIENYQVAVDDKRQAVLSITRKVQAAAPAGRPVKRYFAINPACPSLPPFETGFDTQAAARASLAQHARYGHQSVTLDQPMEIIAITRREGGAPLVAATVSCKSVTTTVQVETRKKVASATRGKARAGWYFYGWVAS